MWMELSVPQPDIFAADLLQALHLATISTSLWLNMLGTWISGQAWLSSVTFGGDWPQRQPSASWNSKPGMTFLWHSGPQFGGRCCKLSWPKLGHITIKTSWRAVDYWYWWNRTLEWITTQRMLCTLSDLRAVSFLNCSWPPNPRSSRNIQINLCLLHATTCYQCCHRGDQQQHFRHLWFLCSLLNNCCFPRFQP